MDELLIVAPAWHTTHAGAVVGVLAMEPVVNPASHETINQIAETTEQTLRHRYGSLDRDALWAEPPLPAYLAYYKRFGQRYHVAMQLESVVRKGKSIPRVAALVEAMFIAELSNLLLTAGHDLGAITRPIRLDVGRGDECYAIPSGSEIMVKPGDMYTADSEGVLSAIITGPAARARIGSETRAALFVCYGPPGVTREAMERHLETITANVRRISPAVVVIAREIVVGSG